MTIALATLSTFKYLGSSKPFENTWKTFGQGCHGPGGRNLSIASASFHVLPSGDKIPSVALGVWQAGGAAVKAALEAGYRHIDDAWIYRNEEEVGAAIQESGVAREEIFLTSKLWNSFHSPEDIEPALDQTLSSLKTSYLDLYLIHWPVAFKREPYESGSIVIDKELTGNPYPTWQKLEELVDKGKIRNIGVSNFNVWRYENLTANPLKYQPAVNQVELNFWNPQPELLEWAKNKGVLLEAYSPLGSNRQVKETVELPVIKRVAEELGITPAQAIISWHVQRGTIVLPRSVHEEHIRENLQIVTLPTEYFASIEKAAVSHPPQRLLNPSKGWGLDFDIFA